MSAGTFKTETYFKTVDRNGYIPINSCHYALWLLNIPKGQMMRLKRNCTEGNDFKEQASMIGQRFVQKGYQETFLLDNRSKE